MDTFLKLKAWQLFLLLVGLPLMSIFLLFSVIENNENSLFLFFSSFGGMNAMLLFGWLWTLGTRLNRYAPYELRPSLRLFKFSITYITLYFVIAITAFHFTMNGPLDKVFLLSLIPFHLVGMYFMFYCLIFIAKNLIISETNAKPGLKNLLPTFFLLWMYPFGLWFIQPRINKLHRLYR